MDNHPRALKLKSDRVRVYLVKEKTGDVCPFIGSVFKSWLVIDNATESDAGIASCEVNLRLAPNFERISVLQNINVTNTIGV